MGHGKEKMDHAETIDELAKCISLYARGDRDTADRALLTVARAVHAARKSGDAEAPTKVAGAARTEMAQRLFAYWQEQCQHQRAKLTPERARCIVARLKEGYSEADIRAGIDGAAVAAHVNDETGQRYDDITLICRNGSKLESFIARAGAGAVSDVDARVDEPSVDNAIRDLRRAMAKAKADDDQPRYLELSDRLTLALKRRGAA